jgi:hypothetical protein
MNKGMTGELQGIWMHGHAEEWRPAVSRVVHWAKRGWAGTPPGASVKAPPRISGSARGRTAGCAGRP